MKKILLINSLDQINHAQKIQKKFYKIFVFDYKLAIICSQKKINTVYINDANKKFGSFNNLSNLFKNSFYLSKYIDQNIYLFDKRLISNNFFKNYHKFALCNVFLDRYYNYMNFLIKKYPKTEFFYFRNNSLNFDFLQESIKVFKSKYKKKFIRIKNLNLKPKFNKIYPNLYDDSKISLFKNIYKNLINFNNYNKKKILIYLLEKEYVNRIKKFSKLNNLSIKFYTKKIFKKKYFDENLFKKKFKIKFFKDKLKNSFYEKLIISLSPYVINEVLETKENISNIFKKKSIDLYCTSHTTLVSSTIRDYLNKNNVKSLTCLHGGTVGHFNKGFFWPDLSHNHLKNKKLSFCQTYSKQHLKDILINEKNFREKTDTEYVSFKSDTFLKLKKITKPKNSKYNIGYITQSNNNVLTGLNKNFNDPFNLYKFRKNFIRNIFQKENKIRLYLSSTEDENNFLFDNNEFKNSKDLKKIQIYKWNAIEVLKKVNTIILEQPSTTLIESLFLNIQNIVVINNPLWKFQHRQKLALDKRVIFVDDYKDIINFLFKNKKKTLRNKLFINQYYNPKKNNNIDKILNQLIG